MRCRPAPSPPRCSDAPCHGHAAGRTAAGRGRQRGQSPDALPSARAARLPGRDGGGRRGGAGAALGGELRRRAARHRDARARRARRAGARAPALARVGPSRDHGDGLRQARGRRRGAAARCQRLRHEAARPAGGAGAPRDAAHAAPPEPGDPSSRRGPREQQPLRARAVRPLPERRGRVGSAGLARGAAARRRVPAGDAADVGPARLHAAHRGPAARGRAASAQLVSRGDGRRDHVPPRDGRRVRGRRDPGDLRRAAHGAATTRGGRSPAPSRCRRRFWS